MGQRVPHPTLGGSPISFPIRPVSKAKLYGTSSVTGIHAVASSLALHSQELDAVNQEMALQAAARSSITRTFGTSPLAPSPSPHHGRRGAETSRGKMPLSSSQVLNFTSARGEAAKVSTTSALELEARRLLHRVKELSGLPAPAGGRRGDPGANQSGGASLRSRDRSSGAAIDRCQPEAPSGSVVRVHRPNHSQLGRHPRADVVSAVDVARSGAGVHLDGLLSEIELQATMQRLLEGAYEHQEDASEDDPSSSDSLMPQPDPGSSGNNTQIIIHDERAAAGVPEGFEPESKAALIDALDEVSGDVAEERGRLFRLKHMTRAWQMGIKLQKRKRLYAEISIKSQR